MAVLDLETTGTNRVRDRIIDLALVIIRPDEKRETFTYRVNPGIPIPPAATNIHGIRDEDVADAPSFKDQAPEIRSRLEGCDLAGFNAARYDIPLLCEEFARAGIPFSMEGRRIVDAQILFHLKEPRDLSAALMYYCGAKHDGAHGALDDVEATIQVLEAQLERYPDLPRTVRELDALCNPREADWVDQGGRLKWEGDEIVINFGAKGGIRLRDLVQKDTGYLNWMLTRDFPEEVKAIIRGALNGQYPVRSEKP